MTSTFATYDGEVLRPDEPLPLARNARVRVTIELATAAEAPPRSFLETARDLQLEGPADWSERVDDYLCGEVALNGDDDARA